MIQWKERLYAFLLRRSLGPYLAPESLEELHACIDQVSISEGTFSLRNVSLSLERLSRLVPGRGEDGGARIEFRRAWVSKLEIVLSLVEHDGSTHDGEEKEEEKDEGENAEQQDSKTCRGKGTAVAASEANNDSSTTASSSSASLAWRAITRLGYAAATTTTPSVRVSLVANVTIEGLELDVAPMSKLVPNLSEEKLPSHQPSNSSSSSGRPTETEVIDAATSAGAATTTTTMSAVISSYLEAALASLRLSVQLRNVSVRIMNVVGSDAAAADDSASSAPCSRSFSWLEVRLQSATYRDHTCTESSGDEIIHHRQAWAVPSSSLPSSQPPPYESSGAAVPIGPPSSYETVLNKVVEFTRVTVLVGSSVGVWGGECKDSDGTSGDKAASPRVGSSCSGNASTVALLDGKPSRVVLRAVEYRDLCHSTSPGAGGVPNAFTTTVDKTRRRKIQNDIQVLLNQRLNVGIDPASLVQIQSIARGFLSVAPDRRSAARPGGLARDERSEHRRVPTAHPEDTDVSDADPDGATSDFRTIDGIMNEYHKARILAQQNHYRGGMMLPSDEDEASSTADLGSGDVTFDMFFDANEHSVGRLSTILKESVQVMNAGCPGEELSLTTFVHTKLRFHLKEGTVKVSFDRKSDSAPARRRADEYLLVSFSEVTASTSLSHSTSEHSLSVFRIDVEDSQLIGPSDPRSAEATTRRVDIGTLIKFNPSSSENAASEHGIVVSDPPCLLVSAKCQATDRRSYLVEIDITLEPFELTYRDRTVTYITQLIASLSSDQSEIQPHTATETETTPRNVLLFCSCPEMTLSVPVHVGRTYMDLYHRRGYLQDKWVARSSLCLTLTGLTFEVGSEVDAPAVALAIHNAILYVLSPCHNSEGAAHRFDVFSFSGRTEVDPIIAVSLALWNIGTRPSTNQSIDDNGSKATELFPKVPAISSFKARQEDEDDDKRVDQALSSNAKEFDLDSKRSKLRVADPQPSMLSAAAASSLVLEIRIPEIIADVSIEELYILYSVGTKLTAQGTSKPPASDTVALHCISVVVICDALLLEISQNVPDDNVKKSLVIRLEKLHAHVLLHGPRVGQVRFLAHDFGLLEVSRSDSSCSTSSHETVQDKFRRRMEGVSCASPLFLVHRTSLFTAISSRSPVLLLDVIDHASEHDCNETSLHTNVYMTLYDLTYRVNYDDRVVERLLSLLSYGRGETAQSSVVVEPARFRVTRLFFTMVDCNVDYSSSVHFSTPSRMILRIGDFKVSSNVVSPKPSVQAVSASVGDVALYVAKTRYPYSFENSQFRWLYLTSASTQTNEDSPDSVQKTMGLITIALLDSLDVVVASTRDPSALDPKLMINATIGELGIFACKDSFARLISTLSELAADMTALDVNALEELRSKNCSNFEDGNDVENNESVDSPGVGTYALEDLKRQSALRPTAGTSCSDSEVNEFLLDGYDWTTIDTGSRSSFGVPSGEEQSARWYADSTKSDDQSEEGVEEVLLPTFAPPEISSSAHTMARKGPRIISHHFPSYLLSDPLVEPDGRLAAFAGTNSPPSVGTRVLVHDFRIKVRFFDGFDWPELLPKARRSLFGIGAFVIEEQQLLDTSDQEADNARAEKRETSRKGKLMEDLLGDVAGSQSPFRDVPLPEERGDQLREQAWLQRLGRRPSKYFQVSGSGIRMRLDSMEESTEHRLASVLNAMVQDFFLAETISSDRPVKLAGEWVNEMEHPRDSKDGLLAVKMATWHPTTRVTPNNEIVNDEAEIVFRMLPLRCIIDQRAVRFARSYFVLDDASAALSSGGDEFTSDTKKHRSRKLYSMSPPLFRSYRFLGFKLKVDYRPEKLNPSAIYNGALVELINLSPIDGLVLRLQPVRGEGEVGFGALLIRVVSHWVDDVCSTQLHKFVTSARAVDPFVSVGSAAVDMIILPWDAIQNGESVRRALRAGTKAFAETVVTETLNVGSRLTKFMADQVARRTTGSLGMNVLPSRPLGAPRGLRDATPHVVETLARGLQAANYTVVIVPYREYRRRGTTGAFTSVIRGIPVAIAAPASGAAEAISYAAIGVRNQVRPDLRREEEAFLRGLYSDT